MWVVGLVRLVKTAFLLTRRIARYPSRCTLSATIVRLSVHARLSLVQLALCLYLAPPAHPSSSATVRAANAFLFEKYLETRVYEVVAAHSTGRPSLVFCASRNGVRTTAECLVKDALVHGPRMSAQAYGQAHSGRCVPLLLRRSQQCYVAPSIAAVLEFRRAYLPFLLVLRHRRPVLSASKHRPLCRTSALQTACVMVLGTTLLLKPARIAQPWSASLAKDRFLCCARRQRSQWASTFLRTWSLSSRRRCAHVVNDRIIVCDVFLLFTL